MKKERWNKLIGTAAGPEFTYRGNGEGLFVFYRGTRAFNWEPLNVTREAARAFVNSMNQLRGKDVERIGRPIAEAFIKKAREAAAVAQKVKDTNEAFARKDRRGSVASRPGGTRERRKGKRKWLEYLTERKLILGRFRTTAKRSKSMFS